MRWRVLFTVIGIVFFYPTLLWASNPPDPQKSSITGAATVANGTSWSSVTIFLRDASGASITSHDSITITSTAASTSFDPSSATLDGSGTVYTKMRSTTVGNVPVTVTDHTTSTQITGSIVFYAPGTNPPAPDTCTDAPPGSAPTLVSAVSSDANSITLTWTAAVAPVTYYLLSYGTASGSYQYGNPNVGGPGTTSYTVGSLSTHVRYYFALRAGNGCAPGAYSNEVSEVAGGAPTTPLPTPTPVSTPTGVVPTQGSPTILPTTALPSPTQGGFIPTDVPQLQETPSPVETFSPPSETPEASPVRTVMILATICGISIIVGVAIWLIAERKKQNRPPPIAY